jgi:hypothetical protein
MVRTRRAAICSCGFQIGFSYTRDDRTFIDRKKEDPMRLNTTYHLLASSTLVLTLAAASYLALADTGGVAGSSSDTAAPNYGRAGGQADFSTAQPPRTPQTLGDAYETTKGHVERAYEQSKEFLVDSVNGRASQKPAGENRVQQGEVQARQSLGVYGRAGVPTYWSTTQPTEPPRVLTNAYEKTRGYVKHAYEKTREFLTQSARHPASEQATPLNGA